SEPRHGHQGAEPLARDAWSREAYSKRLWSQLPLTTIAAAESFPRPYPSGQRVTGGDSINGGDSQGRRALRVSRERGSGVPGQGVPVHGRTALVPGWLAPVSGQQGRADLPVGPGSFAPVVEGVHRSGERPDLRRRRPHHLLRA